MRHWPANFYSTGQVCSNGTRVFVHEAIYDAFVSEVVARSNAIVLGDPFDPATQMGPLVSQQQLEKVAGYLSEVRHSDDVSLLCGGDIDFDSALSVAITSRPRLWLQTMKRMRSLPMRSSVQ
jgi:acyl-CoA reductase-like NAD-dependent aldehyde dehydrogenase